MDENKLIEEALNNNREAAEKLIRLHYREVYGYIYKRTLNKTLTEDLTQEVFLYVLKHLSSFRRKSPFIIWVLRIATSFTNEHYRKENKYLKLKKDIKPLLSSPSINDPKEEFETGTYRIIHEHLQHLPLSYQTIITLKFFEKRKTKEICTIMHKTPVGVRVTLHRALNALKKDIEESVTNLDFLHLYSGEEKEWPTFTPKNKGKERIR